MYHVEYVLRIYVVFEFKQENGNKGFQAEFRLLGQHKHDSHSKLSKDEGMLFSVDRDNQLDNGIQPPGVERGDGLHKRTGIN